MRKLAKALHRPLHRRLAKSVSSAIGVALPANVPAGWRQAWKFSAAAYSSWDDVKRTGGNQFEGYADGYGIFQWGTDTGSTYDARGTAGQDEDFCPDPDYSGWTIQNVTFEDGQMVVKIGLATAFGIEDLVPYRDTDTRYTLVGARFSTEESLKFKGDHAMRIVATWPDETGIWSAIWSLTKGRSPLVTPSLFEIDYAEVVNADVNNKRVWQTNAHGDTTPGGTYETSDSWTDVGETIGGVEREFLIVRVGDVLTFYLDGVEQKSFTIDADWDAKDDFSYLRFDFDACNTAVFPGIYDGVPDVIECKVRSIQIFMPPSDIGTNLVYTPGVDDGYGPDRISGQPVTAGVSPGSWTSSGSSSTGTPVGGVTPIVQASGGNTWDRRYYTGSWQIDNDTLHANEPGATRTNCGFDYGTTYHFEYVFDYGTSNAGYVDVGVGGGGNLVFTIAGTSVTPSVGTALNAAITTDSDGRKVLSFDWVADETGDSHISLGPNSSTIGQTIIWYTAEARPLGDGAASGPQVFVDSVGGSDSNSGQTNALALQTLGALLTALAGDATKLRFQLLAGSSWRESLAPSGDGYQISVGGTGAVPIITGADVHNSGWGLQSGKSNVYEKSIAHNATGSSRLTVYTSAGVLLTRVASAATCESTAGSFVDKKGSDGTPWLVQVHMPNSATPNGQSPLVTVRDTALAPAGANAVITGPLRVERALNNNGALHLVNRAGANVSRVLGVFGTKHTLGMGSGTMSDCIAWEADPTTSYETSNTHFVSYIDDPAGKSYLYERCGGYQTTAHTAGLGQTLGFAHGLAGSDYWANGTVRQCWGVGKVYCGFAAGAQTPLTDLLTEGCYANGFDHGWGTGQVRYCLVNQTVVTAQTPRGDLGTCNVVDSAAYFAERRTAGVTNQPFGIIAGGTRTFTNCALVVGGPAGTGTLLLSTGATLGSVAFNKTVFYGAGVHLIHEAALTYTGDYNVFFLQNSSVPSFRFASYYASVLKTTLATWQSASGQDANSVYLDPADQTSGGANAFWLGLSEAANGGPVDGDFRVNPNARVYSGAGTAYIGTFPDGTLITTVGPQNHWDWSTRAAVSGAPSRWPTVPATLAECETYVSDPGAWDFYA